MLPSLLPRDLQSKGPNGLSDHEIHKARTSRGLFSENCGRPQSDSNARLSLQLTAVTSDRY